MEQRITSLLLPAPEAELEASCKELDEKVTWLLHNSWKMDNYLELEPFSKDGRLCAHVCDTLKSLPETPTLAAYKDSERLGALAYLKQHITIRPLQPNPKLLYDGSIEEVLKKMEQVRRLMCYLPGIDCGACGNPNCQSLAEDIVRHEAQFSDCIFMQRNMEKHGKLDQEHAFRLVEKTWGKDRLNKDCYKKGAKYEGQ